MFINGVRPPRMTVLSVGAVIFVIAFVSLFYNAWPSRKPAFTSKAFTIEEMRSMWYNIHKPSIKPVTPIYQPWGAFKYHMKNAQPKFPEPLGKNLCIIDLDNRPFNLPNEIFGPSTMTWNNASHVHGLSMGILNHWLYAKLHGYKYYYIATETPSDRRASWKKPRVIAKILQEHDTCVYLDSDAIFLNLDLPFEWLMNYWDIDPNANSLSLAVDPDHDFNKDKFGKLNLNTGFIIAQNIPKTYEVLEAWDGCTNQTGKHPECFEFRFNGPGRPTDQGGFGTFIRYDYPNDIKQLDCSDANGYPASNSGCEGHFIRHVWTGKDSWIKVFVGEQVPGPYLELFHKEYKSEMPTFYLTEKQLMEKPPPPPRKKPQQGS